MGFPFFYRKQQNNRITLPPSSVRPLTRPSSYRLLRPSVTGVRLAFTSEGNKHLYLPTNWYSSLIKAVYLVKQPDRTWIASDVRCEQILSRVVTMPVERTPIYFPCVGHPASWEVLIIAPVISLGCLQQRPAQCVVTAELVTHYRVLRYSSCSCPSL